MSRLLIVVSNATNAAIAVAGTTRNATTVVTKTEIKNALKVATNDAADLATSYEALDITSDSTEMATKIATDNELQNAIEFDINNVTGNAIAVATENATEIALKNPPRASAGPIWERIWRNIGKAKETEND